MPGSGSDYKAQVLGAIDIVELISRTVALKRRGRNYVGLCPFHQEKTPSFTVLPDRQYFTCFGCKVKGNAIDFVMKRDRIEFVDALRMLGQQLGIESPRFGVSRQAAGEKQVLLEMHSAACAFFEKLLSHPDHGVAARAYLAGRQINEESVKRFQIGLALDSWDALLAGPVGQKFKPEQLALGGLVKARKAGTNARPTYYDTFRNRLMFPIRDDNGRVIAFGGRVMPGSQDPAKYLNSPETPLFSKSRCIFGIDLARQKMVETRTAVVVEGYTDVIVAHQFGLANVVSVLGTAMTEQHVTTLRRFADRIVLLFDADAAGHLAADRTIGLFLSQPVEIAIASMPAGVDPDEFLLDRGADAFRTIIDGATDALSYQWKRLVSQFSADGGGLTGQQKAVQAYLGMLASARGTQSIDPIRWGGVLARVSRLTEIPMDELNRRFRGRKMATNGPVLTAAAPENEAPQPQFPSGKLAAERHILGALLLEPDRWSGIQQVVGSQDFGDARHRQLAEIYWQHQRDEGEPVLNDFLTGLPDSELVALAVEAADEVQAMADIEGTLNDALAYLRRMRDLREEQKLVAALRRTTEESQDRSDVDLLRELQEKRRRGDPWRVP